MNVYDPLESCRFPKRHDFTIQECRALDVREVVCWLTDEQHRTLPTITLESGLVLVARKCGSARRWHFLCPTCHRPCEYLYLPPGEAGEPHATVEPAPEVYPGGPSPADLAWAEAEGGWFAVVARAIAREQAAASGRHGRAMSGPQARIRLRYEPVGNWRCRKCWNLTYGSQRFGRTHALRRQLPPRRSLTHRRRLQKASRARRKLYGTEET
jgi:hypothetical protein